jgi:hypothetical protein
MEIGNAEEMCVVLYSAHYMLLDGSLIIRYRRGDE